MSTTTIAKKRKSADGTSSTSKKVKMTKSADKPQPIKSALKKSKSSTASVPTSNGPAKKNTTKKILPAEPVEEEDGNTDLTPDQTAALLAGFSSSEEEFENEEEGGVALSSLPKAPTTEAIQKNIKNTSEEDGDPETTPQVLYIGRIPYGFYEKQMRAYFSQFGDIKNLRLARNKKTGKSQHYAFIEFESASVADIVARTMDKYLLFGHLLQVRKVPRESVKEDMFKNANKKSRKPKPSNMLERKFLKRGVGREQWGRRVEKENGRRAGKAQKLKEMGYEFEMPALKSVDEVPVKEKAVREAEGGAEDGEEDVKAVTNGEVETEPAAVELEKKTKKKRPAQGKTEVKKVTKKRRAQ